MQMMKPSLILIGMVVATAALASGEHAGGHDEEEQHGMAGHHGPGAWNAPEEAATRPNPVEATPESIARGEEIFEHNCALCHGETGQGDGPAAAGLDPKPADLRVMAPMHPPGDLAWKIEEGRGPMPSWKATLSEEQIWDAVNYLKHGLGEAESTEDEDTEHGHGKHHQ